MLNPLEEAQRLMDALDEKREALRREAAATGDTATLMDTSDDSALDQLDARLSSAQPSEYAEVLARAQELHTRETARFAERKRKRQERHEAEALRMRKVDTEVARVHAVQAQRAAASAELYALFSDVQAVSNDHQLGLRCPELVVVGGQSDGKSTFVEALLGFTFNVVSSNIGTRRPLVIQMLNNKRCADPVCRFRSETSDAFDENPTPVAALSQAITERTNAVAGSDGSRVHSKPIILRVEFASCANLTIYDTPGFRIGGDAQLAHDIRAMVQDLIAPPDRLIVCLEQSTVEWANSLSRPLVAQADPHFKRTVFVVTKFDNRCKELRSRDEALKYLRGENLPPNAPLLFLSLPVERNAKPMELQDLIQMCYVRDYEHLLRIGVEDKAITSKLGFLNVKTHLERELATRYQAAFLPTLERLETIVSDLTRQIECVAASARETDPALLRAKAASYVRSLCALIERLLAGSAAGDPLAHGQTLAEERRACPSVAWEALDHGYPVTNAARRLYGSAQFHRFLNEFRWVVLSAELPPTSIDEVAAALGTHPSHNLPSYESAACDLVQLKSRAVLLPLLHTAMERCQRILLRLFDVATATLAREDYSVVVVQACEPFTDALRSTYAEYVARLCRSCSGKLRDDVDALTSVMDWEAAAAAPQPSTASPQGDATAERVARQMSRGPMERLPASREVDDTTHQAFVGVCQLMFAHIRDTFVALARTKLHANLLKPMFQALSEHVADAFRDKHAGDSFREAFEAGARAVETRRAALSAKLKSATALRDDFRRAGARITAVMVAADGDTDEM